MADPPAGSCSCWRTLAAAALWALGHRPGGGPASAADASPSPSGGSSQPTRRPVGRPVAPAWRTPAAAARWALGRRPGGGPVSAADTSSSPSGGAGRLACRLAAPAWRALAAAAQWALGHPPRRQTRAGGHHEGALLAGSFSPAIASVPVITSPGAHPGIVIRQAHTTPHGPASASSHGCGPCSFALDCLLWLRPLLLISVPVLSSLPWSASSRLRPLLLLTAAALASPAWPAFSRLRPLLLPVAAAIASSARCASSLGVPLPPDCTLPLRRQWHLPRRAHRLWAHR